MEVLPCRDTLCAVALTAQVIEMRLYENPKLVLGLATGRTMEAVYKRLIASGVSFAHCTTFNLDEYIGLPPDDPRSYAAYMRKHLFDHVDINPARTHLPNGMDNNFAQAASRYEEKIVAAGGIDLQLLGIGTAGHIGFNEPISSLRSRTRDKILTLTTRQQNAEMFGGNVGLVPKKAMTMGVGTILESREALLLACGASKADVISSAVEGPLTSRVSASAIQLHPACTVVVDDAAAGQLVDLEYYRYCFEHEDKWSEFRELL